jgi:hypothetical protein
MLLQSFHIQSTKILNLGVNCLNVQTTNVNRILNFDDELKGDLMLMYLIALDVNYERTQSPGTSSSTSNMVTIEGLFHSGELHPSHMCPP